MVKDFVDATNKGWEYAFKNKEEIVDLIYNKYSQKNLKNHYCLKLYRQKII